jgi:hypothetical protein
MGVIKSLYIIIFFFLLLYINNSVVADDYDLYEVDDGYVYTFIQMKSKNITVLNVDIFFSYVCKFEKNKTSLLFRDLIAEKIRNELMIEIRDYVYTNFPKYTIEQLLEIINDKKGIDIITDLKNHISNDEKFKDVEIKSIVFKVQ